MDLVFDTTEDKLVVQLPEIGNRENVKKLKLEKEPEWLEFDEESMELNLVLPLPEGRLERVYLEFELEEEI